ncbi:dihydroneopterin aldolase [Leptolyngbya sp. FACHB-36]|uniref:dihydroneopterin aldolase n=1 Tax=Leptolyngbya sp. FACHB-36 TaxID=2692808 RepID=UPI00168150B7|nr:dihydroneopterin aldolase [Leptolyngbya sp. FACHB-36]
MDVIDLKGIRGYGYVGALPEEQVLGQWFEVDVRLWLDLSAAGQNDRLDSTLDYRATIATVQQLIQTSKAALLERLATTIVEAVLQPPVQQVRVSLSKLTAPIPGFDGRITIELTRSR